MAALTAVITDVHYRMSLALIRDLAEAGVRVVACERAGRKADALGFYSKSTLETALLPEDGWLNALYGLCERLFRQEGEKPALLPVGAKTLAALAEPETRERFSRICGLCLPTPRQLDLFNDKAAVAELAGVLDIPVPRSFGPELPDDAAFPCVIKPLCGEKFGLPAAGRYVIAANREALEQAVLKFQKLTGELPVVQEYLPGGGMGCSVLAERGKILASLCHRRLREYPVSGGPSTCCVSFFSDKLLEYARRMIAETEYSGPAMLEFKEDGAGEPRLLEINPRIWGSYPLSRAAKTGMSYAWFAAAYRSGNPGSRVPEIAYQPISGKKMIFCASDAAAALGYWKRGERKRAAGALGDLLNPGVRDGLWEWGDPKPAVRYFKALLKRN